MLVLHSFFLLIWQLEVETFAYINIKIGKVKLFIFVKNVEVILTVRLPSILRIG